MLTSRSSRRAPASCKRLVEGRTAVDPSICCFLKAKQGAAWASLALARSLACTCLLEDSGGQHVGQPGNGSVQAREDVEEGKHWAAQACR